MNEKTFTKEIIFISLVHNGVEFVETLVKKTATFKELSRTDKTQNDLCWLIMELFESKKKKVHIKREEASELVDLFIDKMLIISDTFTEQDKTDFLNDNGAIISFGKWLCWEKCWDFFLKLTDN